MGKIILLEKDNSINNQLTRIIEDRLSHVKIKLVSNCDECLTEMQVSTPDILMMGANVSDCNCLDMIARFRKMYPGITIILITDYNIDEYRKGAILQGANHVISRDLWTGTEILALINTILTGKTDRASTGAEGVPIKEA